MEPTVVGIVHPAAVAGANARGAGWLRALGRRLLDPMCLLLIVAATISAATGDHPSAVVTLASCALLDTVQEQGTQRADEALEACMQ